MYSSRVLRRQLLIALAWLTVLLCATPVFAQEPFTPVPTGLVAPSGPYNAGIIRADGIELINYLPGGPGRAIQIHGAYGYTASAGQLVIFDISDPRRPTLVSFLPLGNTGLGGAQMAAVLDDWLFIHVDDAIWTVSVADPTRPRKLTETKFGGGGSPWSLYGHENHLYLAYGSDVLIMAIQPDGSLVEASRLSLPPNSFILNAPLFDQASAYFSLAYYNDIVGSESEPPRVDLVTADLSNPNAPEIVEIRERDGGIGAVAAEDRLYVFGYIKVWEDSYIQGWSIYDRTDPLLPTKLGHVSAKIGFFTPGTIAWGKKLLIPNYDFLHIIDLTETTNPHIYDVAIDADALAVVGEELYATGKGFHIYDAEALPAVVEVGAFDGYVRGPNDVLMRDEHVLVVDGDGLNVFDRIKPLDLVKVALVPSTAFNSNSSFIDHGDKLYASAGFQQTIADISRPDRPAITGFNRTTTNVAIRGVRGDIVFLDSYNPVPMTLMDTSAPSLWKQVATLAISDLQQSFLVVGDRAYGTNLGGGLTVFDVSDPTNPHQAAEFQEFDELILRESGGDYLFATGRTQIQGNSLHVLDISDPDRPIEVSRYLPRTENYININDIDYAAPYLYVADSESGLYALDVEDPRLLLEVGRYETVGGIYRLAVNQQLIGAVTSSAGMWLFAFRPSEITEEIATTGGSLAVDDGGIIYTLPAGIASTPISLTHAARTFGASPPSVPAHLTPTEVVFRNWGVDAATGEPVTAETPYSITVSYADVAGPIPPETLRLYRWTGESWAPLPSSIDMTNQRVAAVAESFGIFALMAEPFKLRLPFIQHTYYYP